VRRMTRLLWMLFQTAVVAFWVWVAIDSGGPIGPAVTLGVLSAFLFTIIPIAVVEGIKDVRRLYLPAFRRWRARSAPRATRGYRDKPIDRLRGPRAVRLPRQPAE
jgi:hypothetical protein